MTDDSVTSADGMYQSEIGDARSGESVSTLVQSEALCSPFGIRSQAVITPVFTLFVTLVPDSEQLSYPPNTVRHRSIPTPTNRIPAPPSSIACDGESGTRHRVAAPPGVNEHISGLIDKSRRTRPARNPTIPSRSRFVICRRRFAARRCRSNSVHLARTALRSHSLPRSIGTSMRWSTKQLSVRLSERSLHLGPYRLEGSRWPTIATPSGP